MSKPLVGTMYASKMRPKVLMKIHNADETITKPAYSTLSATYNGTKATTTFVLDDNLDFAVGEYFTFSTPQRNFNISNGAVAVTGFKNIIIAGVGATPFETITKIKVALSYYDEIQFTDISDTSFKITATNGGLCVAGTVGTSALTITGSATAGTGEWAEIGELADDLALGGELTTAKTARGTSYKTGETYAPTFKFINVNQTAKESIDSTFEGQDVDLMFWDTTDFKSPIFMLRGIPCNTMLNPIGDTASIDFNMSIEYASKQLGTSKVYWTFEDETVV